MKLIGIAGSVGKTSTAEIIYQYMVHQGIQASLYSSNGLFIKEKTRKKDFLQTTLHETDLIGYLKEDEQEGVAYAIVEITAESIKRGDEVHLLPFEVIALTNFYEGLHNHFDDKEDYLACKRKMLDSISVKQILLRSDDRGYSLFQDFPHLTYGRDKQSTYPMSVVRNELTGLTLFYKNTRFQTNLITAYHGRNMACSLAVLDYLGILDMECFSEFAKNIHIRGRFEKLTYEGKTIILDTGYFGADTLLIGLESTLQHQNYKVMYSSIPYQHVTDWVKDARKRVGEYIRRAKYIYLTSPTNHVEEEEIFLNETMCDRQYSNYRYLPDPYTASLVALNELKDNEVLIIITREHYRSYRHYFHNMFGDLL